LKSFRLPKKFDGTHRGFGFVEFLTKHDAKSAMAALAGTHFYGRHLVLEWAADADQDEDLMETEVDALRRKTREQFGGEAREGTKRGDDDEEPENKRRKIVVKETVVEDSD